MNNLELLARVPAPLLAWYDKEARDLPWRQNTDPYRVWVSEIMLQQTRVEAVIPYYERFLAAFPDLKALADAPEEQLLKLWEGLGYYSRARNLQKAAREALSRFGGLPGQVQELSSLPGIGAYTAGAIASIAFSRPVPAVDGNVLRVVARLTDSHDDVLSPAVKREAEKAVAAVIPHDRPGDFNQAVMDLGATVCLPNGAPRCEVCPLAELCLGLARSTAPELPVKAKKKERRVEEKTVLVLIDGEGRAALERRPARGLLAGLWQLPLLSGHAAEKELREALEGWGMQAQSLRPLGDAVHIFSHVEWRMTGWLARVRGEGPFTWAAPEELEERYALPSAFRAYRPACLEGCAFAAADAEEVSPR